MWSNLLYMLPVTSILYNCTINEEIKMEGDLGDEIERIFKKYLINSKLKFVNKGLHATIYATYPAGTNLWSIIDGIMVRFQLIAYIDERDDNNILFQLKEGASWKR